jgi:AcrR family transcriptional regulator
VTDQATRVASTGSAAARPYHHGNLRQALIDAGVDLAAESGPDAVVLREATRRAGASHNAGYRHFAGRDGLLAAVAAEGMSRLATAMTWPPSVRARPRPPRGPGCGPSARPTWGSR